MQWRIRLLLLTVVIGFSGQAQTQTDTSFWQDWRRWGRDTKQIRKARKKNPKEVGALTASSPWLARTLAQSVEGEATVPHEPRKILEIGCGPGNVTECIIAKMHPDDRLDAVECTKVLYDQACVRIEALRSAAQGQGFPDVRLHCSAFPDFDSGVEQYDDIISTLPFVSLPNEVVITILPAIFARLKPGGTFTYMTFLGANWGTKVWKTITLNFDELKEYNQKMDVFNEWLESAFELERKPIVWLNFTPSWVCAFRKKD